jgi:hypothetical protein
MKVFIPGNSVVEIREKDMVEIVVTIPTTDSR